MNPDDYLPSLQKRIGKKLVELRKAKGYTDHEIFAKDHDLSRSSYGKLEAGKGNPTLKTIALALAPHDMTIEDLFRALEEKS